ncbi:phosphotransferase [Ornithinibacillus scapharcae]|uniref:phosphotransferase n=1 Tax=Ornithinibacillus scapharcae TaxID=1147159 RepID=UPI000225BF59|nr:phosphotransferase [Ornithinibacillus scapharcae]
MEKIRRILETYRVYPIDIDKITERLYRIKGNNQSYALKKSGLKEEKVPFWLDIYRTAEQQKIVNILPLYLNKSGNLFTKDGNDIYYLSPWIDSGHRTHAIEKIYQNIGYIHAKTRKVTEITEEIRQTSRENFLVFKRQSSELRKRLMSHVEQFESQHFMSPVELLVCTQYRDLVHVFYGLDKRLNQYIDSLEEMNDWKLALCHGRLKDSHVLHGNQLYVINWEQASYQHPVLDLTRLLKSRTLHYDSDKRLLLDKFKFYLEENKLDIPDLALLSIYLLDPSEYLRTIDEYVERNSDLSMIDHVIKLQRYHRQLLFGIQFSEYMEQEFEMVAFDESGSET